LNKIILTATIVGGAIIVILTGLFSFTPDSASQSNIPIFKDMVVHKVNDLRIKAEKEPLRIGHSIAADKQARFLITQQLNPGHAGPAGETPEKRYMSSGESGFLGENISVYGCSDLRTCKTAISIAIDDMLDDPQERQNIYDDRATHLSPGIEVGNRKIAIVLDFESH